MGLSPCKAPKGWRLLESHPFADIFPLLSDEDLNGILSDIRVNGFDFDRPIILFEGRILDGRNRHRACLLLDAAGELREKPEFSTYDPSPIEPCALAWAISVNLHRRHLSDDERALVAGKIANLGEGRPGKTPPIGGVSQPDAAEMLNVSPRQVSRAKVVLEVPELAEEVMRGERSLSGAEKEARKRLTITIPRAPIEAARALRKAYDDEEFLSFAEHVTELT